MTLDQHRTRVGLTRKRNTQELERARAKAPTATTDADRAAILKQLLEATGCALRAAVQAAAEEVGFAVDGGRDEQRATQRANQRDDG